MATNRAALEAEAKADTKDEGLVSFTYKGKKYIVDANSDNWSLETMLAFEENKAVTVVRSILGPEQWSKYMSTKPTNKDFTDFADKLFDVIGIKQGE